jgi:hypothetical protein
MVAVEYHAFVFAMFARVDGIFTTCSRHPGVIFSKPRSRLQVVLFLRGLG